MTRKESPPTKPPENGRSLASGVITAPQVASPEAARLLLERDLGAALLALIWLLLPIPRSGC